MIVERVSGTSFQDFTRARLFQPLGMTHTSWRDDYTRIVKGRAIAYHEDRDGGEFHTDMPFENVYGNGGLLTTVGDLLRWSENFVTPVVGDASFVAEQQQPGTFADGRTHGYALGLFVGRYKGVREVYHSGSTAGYSAFLTRFPDSHVSVAVLCNVDTARATQYAHDVADVYLGDRVRPAASRPAADVTAGQYRSLVTGVAVTLARDSAAARTRAWTFDGGGRATATDEFGTSEGFQRVEPVKPTAADLAAYAGTYESAEAETTLTAAVENGGLVLKRRPATAIKLTPVYADAFSAGSLGTVIFRRDASSKVTALSVVQDRVWDMRFTRR